MENTDLIFVEWNNLRWIRVRNYETVAQGTFDEPTFASAKASARESGLRIGATLSAIAPMSIAICKAGTIEGGAE